MIGKIEVFQGKTVLFEEEAPTLSDPLDTPLSFYISNYYFLSVKVPFWELNLLNFVAFLPSIVHKLHSSLLNMQV